MERGGFRDTRKKSFRGALILNRSITPLGRVCLGGKRGESLCWLYAPWSGRSSLVSRGRPQLATSEGFLRCDDRFWSLRDPFSFLVCPFFGLVSWGTRPFEYTLYFGWLVVFSDYEVVWSRNVRQLRRISLQCRTVNYV